MRKPMIVLALALLAPAAAAPPITRAAVLIALSLPELVAKSDFVVVANAEDESSRYAGKVIVTDVTLRVITSMKGPATPGSTLKVTHLGGAVDNVGLRVPGAAQFKLGQSAVVFLRRDPDGGLVVTGMSQGVLPITGNGTGAVVESAGRDAQLVHRDARGAFVEMPHQAPGRRVLSELLGEIDAIVHSLR